MDALDPTGYFTFDLKDGYVRSRGGSRLLLISENVLAPLIMASVQAGDLTSLRSLGRQLGEEITSTLQDAAADTSADAVAGRVSGMLALFGWGHFELERWGDAVVALVHGLPTLDEQRLAVAALLGGLLSTLAERECACVPVGPGSRFLIADPSMAESLWVFAKTGAEVSDIVKRMAQSEAQ